MYYKNSNLEVTNNLLQLLSEADWEKNGLDESLLQDLFRNFLYGVITDTSHPKYPQPTQKTVEIALRIIFNEIEQITPDGVGMGLPQYVHDIIDSYKAEG